MNRLQALGRRNFCFFSRICVAYFLNAASPDRFLLILRNEILVKDTPCGRLAAAVAPPGQPGALRPSDAPGRPPW
jgi:hypothetical protein